VTDRATVTATLQGTFRKCFYNPSIEISDACTVDDVDGWDSLSHVRLMLAAERAFGVELAPEETARLRNVGELIDYIMERLEYG
jgi:acyl carrier protein